MIHNTYKLPDICSEFQDVYHYASSIYYMQRIHKEATKQDDYNVCQLLNRAKNESFFERFIYVLRELPGEF